MRNLTHNPTNMLAPIHTKPKMFRPEYITEFVRLLGRWPSRIFSCLAYIGADLSLCIVLRFMCYMEWNYTSHLLSFTILVQRHTICK